MEASQAPAPSQALARLRSSQDLAQLNELEEILLSGRLDESQQVLNDPEEAQRQIIAQLLDAQSDDELENFGNAQSWRELPGIPFEIHGFRWLPSTFEEGPAVFMVVSATNLTNGEKTILTTGGANIMAQLANLAKRGTLVGAVRELVEGTKTRQGFTPLWLRTPEKLRQVRDEAAAS